MSASDTLFLCLTSVSTEQEAESLADDIVKSRLAACVQIDSPLRSVYRWGKKIEKNAEIRLMIFAPETRLQKLQLFVEDRHPYETPKWICFRAEKVSEKYLKWANEVCSLRDFV